MVSGLWEEGSFRNLWTENTRRKGVQTCLSSRFDNKLVNFSESIVLFGKLK